MRFRVVLVLLVLFSAEACHLTFATLEYRDGATVVRLLDVNYFSPTEPHTSIVAARAA